VGRGKGASGIADPLGGNRSDASIQDAGGRSPSRDPERPWPHARCFDGALSLIFNPRSRACGTDIIAVYGFTSSSLNSRCVADPVMREYASLVIAALAWVRQGLGFR
jgi:hypothetical protein